MARVRFENVQKFFGETPAVCELALEIREGEFFSILGPSGCGKTTTLRMVAGFEVPDAGSIFFDDENVTSLPPEKRHTGMVFQNYALFPHLTVFENVAFGLRARKHPPAEISPRVAAALDLVEMRELQNRPVTQLSGGQQQRVALARALAVQPKILLLDEPLSNLDAQLRRTTRTELKNLQRRLGITTIYVTHDQEEALALSDRILVMEKGSAQQVGTPEEIYHIPANLFVMSFIGASNALPGTITAADNGKIQVSGENWQLRLPADREHQWPVQTSVHVAFRPEHGRIVPTSSADTQPAEAKFNGAAGEFLGEVQSVEFGGSHWLVQCQIGRQSCFVRVPAEEIDNAALRSLAGSRKIQISVQPQHVRIFPATAL
ncbi:ABC transporter ATP-binding protein [candidate division KSB1 bacterium]|nr:ABC transporter ATP-binding protein [candidate division KSB1 bacterium]